MQLLFMNYSNMCTINSNTKDENTKTLDFAGKFYNGDNKILINVEM